MLAMVLFISVVLLLSSSVLITPFYPIVYAEIMRCEGGSTCDGTEENDHMKGDVNNNSMRGLGGVDTLEGGEGFDHITGGDGDDKLSGGDGNDILEGQDDDDKLRGGDGKDQLFGGSGADHFNCGPGNDTIDDFHQDEGDTKTGDCEGHGFEQLQVFEVGLIFK